MLMAHKIAPDPNNAQVTYFAKACGVARFAYNWALEQWGKQYEAWKRDNGLPKPSEAALRRQLNAIKRQQFP
ncbi:helix-turn-helix domain-containing protein [Caldichromatium japonicum]|uniref:helix-turn-helix domain-containing protein n=1 Tax=Caldichromatium japonicum TaxID=2699430 RepID=UPI001B35735B|nr:helix-turn-helix domain-containing protein [Caldichromatium japonicum]